MVTPSSTANGAANAGSNLTHHTTGTPLSSSGAATPGFPNGSPGGPGGSGGGGGSGGMNGGEKLSNGHTIHDSPQGGKFKFGGLLGGGQNGVLNGHDEDFKADDLDQGHGHSGGSGEKEKSGGKKSGGKGKKDKEDKDAGSKDGDKNAAGKKKVLTKEELYAKMELELKGLKQNLQVSRNKENELRDQIISFMSST